jgi:AraC-like DNA-binding protein
MTTTDRQQHVWRIIERYAEDPRLPSPSADLLSREAGVSVRTLYNICQAFTGKSATRYIKQRRLMLAHEMLQRAHPEKATVAQIATFCGFNHLSRFSKNFRDLHGQQPSSILCQMAEAKCTGGAQAPGNAADAVWREMVRRVREVRDE